MSNAIRRLLSVVAGWWLGLLGHRVVSLPGDPDGTVFCRRCMTEIRARRSPYRRVADVRGDCPVVRLYHWSAAKEPRRVWFP